MSKTYNKIRFSLKVMHFCIRLLNDEQEVELLILIVHCRKSKLDLSMMAFVTAFFYASNTHLNLFYLFLNL